MEVVDIQLESRYIESKFVKLPIEWSIDQESLKTLWIHKSVLVYEKPYRMIARLYRIDCRHVGRSIRRKLLK